MSPPFGEIISIEAECAAPKKIKIKHEVRKR
jgi:hypothetical protein